VISRTISLADIKLIVLDFAFEKVDRRGAKEVGDEFVAGVVIDILRNAALLLTPSFITTISSEIDMASSWSWVTKTVVIPVDC
jgi:hypothetical protein